MVQRKNPKQYFPWNVLIAPELGGVKYFFVSPVFGEMIHFDFFFQMGWNHQLVKIDGRKMNFPFAMAYFQGRSVSF